MYLKLIRIGFTLLCVASGSALVAQPTADFWPAKPNLQSGVNVNAPNPRQRASFVWCNGLVVLWGGQGFFSPSYPSNAAHSDGGAYDPQLDQWVARPNLQSGVGAPSARAFHSAVWTGNRMIVWGGHGSLSSVVYSDGGGYDPATDTWEVIPNLNLAIGAPPPRHSHSVVWDGVSMTVFGGTNFGQPAPNNPFVFTGGRYDPVMDQWLPSPSLSTPPSLLRPGANASLGLASNGLIYTWGGVAANQEVDYTANGMRYGRAYNPVSDMWVHVSGLMANAPLYRRSGGHGPYLLGRYVAVLNGTYFEIGDPVSMPPPSGLGETQGGGNWKMNNGAVYDTVTDQWVSRPLLESAVNAPGYRDGHVSQQGTTLAVGSRLLHWGGTKGYTGGHDHPHPTNPPPPMDRFNTGAFYDPVNDVWDWTPGLNTDPNRPPPGTGWYSVWTGEEVIYYSGHLSIQSGAAQVGWSYLGGVYKPPGPLPQLPGPYSYNLTVGEPFEEIIGLWGDPIPTVSNFLHTASASVAQLEAVVLPGHSSLPAGNFPSGFLWSNPDPNTTGPAIMQAGFRTNPPFMPPWLNYNMRRFSGTPPPQAAGTWTVRMTANNSLGTDTKDVTFEVRMNPVFAYVAGPNGEVMDPPEILAPPGQLFQHQIRCVAHPIPAYTVTGLPSWLSHNAGFLSGTPPASVAGQLFVLNVTADNGLGYPATMQLSIRVRDSIPWTLESADVNRDNVVNVLDVQHVIGRILQVIPPGAAQSTGHPQGDVNHDWQVNAADVQAVVNWIVGR